MTEQNVDGMMKPRAMKAWSVPQNLKNDVILLAFCLLFVSLPSPDNQTNHRRSRRALEKKGILTQIFNSQLITFSTAL